MKDVYEVLRHKEAAVANVRYEIESVKFVISLLSEELALKDAGELLRQKEADVARVRHEIENLKIVAPLLSEGLASDELPRMGPDAAAKRTRNIDNRPKATGTDGAFPSATVNPRPTFWELIKRKT